MPRFAAALLLLAALVACATPQEQCIARETRDLRTIDRQIAETEGNVTRGYAIEEYTVDITVVGQCLVAQGPDETGAPRPPVVETCFQDREVTRTRRKSINIPAERAKLASLRDQRRDLARVADRAIAQCRVQFPQ